MITFGFDGTLGIWATVEGEQTLLPINSDTKVEGVKIEKVFEFLREVALEEYSKEGLTLDSNDKFVELDELEEQMKVDDYIKGVK